jgi:hypothetical protein
MIRSARPVNVHRAAELGNDHNNGLIPNRAKLLSQFEKAFIQCRARFVPVSNVLMWIGAI